MSGPRDWSPPEFGERVIAVTPRRRPTGSFVRGVLAATAVVPFGIVSWLLLWQFGLVSSIVGWVAAVLAIALYRWGSGGVISRRGFRALCAILSATVVLGLASGFVYDAARAFSPETVSPVASITSSVSDATFWEWLWSGLQTGRWPTLWVTIVVGIVLAAAGLLPPLLAASGRSARRAGLAAAFVSIAVVIGATAAVNNWAAPVSDPAETLSASGLAAGDCIDAVSEPDAVIDEFPSGPPLVRCDAPHWAEVVYVGSTPGREGSDEYPGGPWLSLEAQVQCSDAFGEYVGVPMEQSTLARQVYFPTEDGWDNSRDRSLVCAVYDPASPTNGTLEGAAR